jgi:fructose-1,6-bisphosphatase II / sedoheptulose-1,7-bisphosphatase|tara:strand:- start:76 stop:1023 length:948 start_codon:yes stop_codon:yes gene_type:complete
MSIDKDLINNFIRITSKAAIAAYKYIGKENKILADKAAVDVMRSEINKLDIDGKIVIGEGELDEAPMLYIGEKLGTGNGKSVDIAVDPVEGTNFVAKNLPGGLSVLAVAERNNLFNAPETYMNKIAINKKIPNDAVDLDNSIKKNIFNIAEARNKDVSKIRACILNRPRHKVIIDELLNLNVKLKLISDGDVAGALLVTDDKYDVDIFLGIGGGPEGVLAASALDAYGCKFQGRFLFNNNKDIERAKSMGITDLKKKYELSEIIKGESVFCATGITNGDLVKGVSVTNNEYCTETLVTHKNSFKNVINSRYPKLD